MQQRNSVRFSANLGKRVTETLSVIRQAFGKESLSRTPKAQTSPRLKKARHVKSMLIIFFDMKAILHKEFVLAGQTANSAYYCDVLRRLCEHVRRLRPNFGDKVTGCYITTPSHTSFFTRQFLTKNNMTVVPHAPYFSLFSQLRIKLKGRHFGTVEVIETERRW
jgi:hypothetical protein